MANTEKLGFNWRGKAWADGEPIPRVLLPDSTYAEAQAAIAYAWNGSTFQKVEMTTGGLIKVSPVLGASRTFANIAAASTDAALVSAVGGSSIRVIAVALLCGATATNITFNSKPGGAGSAISMTFQNAANSGAVLGTNPDGWFQTSVSEGLSATTGAGSTTGVQVVYTVV